VEGELGDAKREAQIHARDTEAALKTLGEAAPPPAEPAVAAPATNAAPRDDLVPVKGSDTESSTTPDPDPVTPVTPPPASRQTTSPVTDPTGAVPPAPPPAALRREVAPSEPPPPASPAPAQP
jgi:hypothetical protein